MKKFKTISLKIISITFLLIITIAFNFGKVEAKEQQQGKRYQTMAYCASAGGWRLVPACTYTKNAERCTHYWCTIP